MAKKDATLKVDAVLTEYAHLFPTQDLRDRVSFVLIECIQTKYIKNEHKEIKEAMIEQLDLMRFNGDYERLL